MIRSHAFEVHTSTSVSNRSEKHIPMRPERKTIACGPLPIRVYFSEVRLLIPIRPDWSEKYLVIVHLLQNKLDIVTLTIHYSTFKTTLCFLEGHYQKGALHLQPRNLIKSLLFLASMIIFVTKMCLWVLWSEFIGNITERSLRYMVFA